jgi:putative nucleotidyltransferase with HDIG domain
MAFEPTLEEQQLLADTLTRNRSRMPVHERIVELLVAIGFAAAVAGLWLASPPRSVSLLPALLCVGMFVLAASVRFDTPFGFTVPTQLAFVPLLFALPIALVPVAVALGWMLAWIPDVLRGRVQPARLLQTLGNSWFAIGPVAVFALAGVQPRYAAPILLGAALAAQFGVDFAVSSVRFAVGRGASLATQLRETWVYVIDAALAGVGLAVARELQSSPFNVLVLAPLLGLLAMFAFERRGRLERLVELNTAYRGTALVLGEVLEADDAYTGAHSNSVVELALAVGERLELSVERRRNLEFGALLHDVGKIAIPKQIINKPGKLDPDEWTIIKTHTIEGQRMLDRVGGFMREVGLIVRSHHERYDGAGYPDALASDEIPIEARVIACCDSWNAMRTDRPYRRALRFEAAVSELTANAGSQFDPVVVVALLAIIASEDAGSSRSEEIGLAA